MSVSICTVLFASIRWPTVLCAALAQHYVTAFFYNEIAGSAWRTLLADDKGVFESHQAIRHFGLLKSNFVQFVVNLLRTCFMVAVLNVLRLADNANFTFLAYADAAILVTLIGLIGQSRELWAQRSPALQVLQILGDLLAAVTGAIVLYFAAF